MTHGVPRACGDDPTPPVASVKRTAEFPAPAGMIRFHEVSPNLSTRVPRACGDDPQHDTKLTEPDRSSPRLRG